MKSFVKETVRGPILRSEYQASGSSITSQSSKYNLPEWEEHFWKYYDNAELAMPAIFSPKNLPVWRIPSNNFLDDKIKVETMDGEELVVNDVDVRSPTDLEYNLHFRKYVESGNYTLTSYADDTILVRKKCMK